MRVNNYSIYCIYSVSIIQLEKQKAEPRVTKIYTTFGTEQISSPRTQTFPKVFLCFFTPGQGQLESMPCSVYFFLICFVFKL